MIKKQTSIKCNKTFEVTVSQVCLKIKSKSLLSINSYTKRYCS